MALRGIDGFDIYESVGQVTTRSGFLQWTKLVVTSGSSGGTDTALIQGRFTGVENKALNISNPSGGGQTILIGSFAANMQTSFVGFATYMIGDNTQGDHSFIMSLVDSSTARMIPITFTQSDGSISTPYGRSVNNRFPVGTWFFVEVGCKVAASGGWLEVRINGVTQYRFDGDVRPYLTTDFFGTSNTVRGTFVNSVYFWVDGVVRNFRIDDVYVCDDTVGPGAFPCNTFLGDRRVLTLKCSAPGDLAQWTPHGATNWENAAVADGDVSYNATSTVGQEDLFQIGDLPASVSQVLAVQITGAYRKDEAASHTLTQRVKSAGVDAGGASYPLQSSYTIYSDLFMLDPATGVAWTPAAVNAMQIGYKLDT